MNITKKQAQEKIIELQNYINGISDEEEWVKIDYTVIPKSLFEKYGVEPFEIMKRKMRTDGKVWNDINYFDARKEAEKLGYRLPSIQEHLLLVEHYSNTNEFLGIEELSYDEDVNHEWIAFNEKLAFVRGGTWNDGTVAGVGMLALSGVPGVTADIIGFRCAR